MRRLQIRSLSTALVALRATQPLVAAGRFCSSEKVAASSGAKPTSHIPSNDNVLPGIDLAKRVADPSRAFPASWSVDEPLAAGDPRIVWKEHYSLAGEKPYYHNVNTNETTDAIPDGFVTRFPQLYRRAGFTVDESGAVTRGENAPDKVTGSVLSSEGATKDISSATEGSGDATKGKALTTKQKLAAYGGGGLLWYLIVHNVCLATIFSLLYFFKVDLVSVAKSYGFNVKVKRSEQVEEIAEHGKKHPPFLKTFVLAIILNKLLVPIQLMFTLATAPLLVHRLEPIAMIVLPKCKAFFHNLKLKVTGATP